jgi:hypothetical protein
LCDQTFCEKSAQNCPNTIQRGALLNNNFFSSKFGIYSKKVAKIWSLYRRISGDFEEKMRPNHLGDIFQIKMRPNGESSPQSDHT